MSARVPDLVHHPDQCAGHRDQDDITRAKGFTNHAEQRIPLIEPIDRPKGLRPFQRSKQKEYRG